MANQDSSLKLKNVVLSEDVSDHDGSSEDEKDAGAVLDFSFDRLSLGPKKKLLVLALGGLIVHRAHKRKPSTIPKNRSADVYSGNFLIYKRPFFDDFIKFLFERFEVGIWSSAMEHNVEGALRNIMGGYKSKLLFIWDQEECTDSGFMCLDNNHKPLFLKELKRLWDKKNTRLPLSGDYSSSNTLLIDTNPYKGLLNPPNTGIFPESYDPGNKVDNFLGPGSAFRVFLDGLAEAKDVPSYVKDHPFGQPAITSAHSDWGFYSKILRRFGKGEAADSKT